MLNQTFHRRSPNLNGANPSSPIDPNDDLVHFCHVAALVMTLYDHLITLDDEVEYIWSQRWSKSKILYLLARYFGDILLISVCVVFLNRDASFLRPCLLFWNQMMLTWRPILVKLFDSCAIGLKFVGTGSMITIIITQLIMQSRVKALYGRLVSVLLTVFWVMEVIAVISLGVASLAAIDVHPVLLHTTRMCNPTYLPRYAFLFWVPVIVFESVLFALALRIAYQNYREIGTWRGASLLYVILRDNFSFFICAFAAYIVTATTWLTANPRYFTVPGSFSCSLTTIMGCRLILNLCEAYHHPPDPDGSAASARARAHECHRRRQRQGQGQGHPESIWGVATSGNNMFFARPSSLSGPGSGSGVTGSRTVRGVWTRTRTGTHTRRAPLGSIAFASLGTTTTSSAGKTASSSVGVVSSESEVTEGEGEGEGEVGGEGIYEMSVVSTLGRRRHGGLGAHEGLHVEGGRNLKSDLEGGQTSGKG